MVNLRTPYPCGELKVLCILVASRNAIVGKRKEIDMPFNRVTTGIVSLINPPSYRNDINGKERTFHANLLKKYIVKNVVSDGEATMDDSPVSASLAVAEVQSSGCDECGCQIFSEPGSLGSKETVGDPRLDDELTGCLRSSKANWMSLQALSLPFCFDTSGRALKKWWDKQC
ncbi:hypothetical protein PoB_004934000 [Plakobranchus ocellatus]|uniref:Uncharacterized protein n=1 Tax=Plakobranchus ocellatus TaxID=259542 RepID=A0AAV4BU56_9GAST|nr:hypothetical protein PoB_004934000 [Plakobranchus ocellatus]